jgi:hypothetical protein
MDRYFDVIYYALAGVILLAVGYSTLAGLELRRSSVPAFRGRALGIASAAVGIAVALLGGLFADAFLKGSLYFQQVRFAAYYVGFALITLGLNATARAAQETAPLPGYLARPNLSSLIVWSLFLVTLAVAVFYLVNPNTFILNKDGYQVQRVIYWVPLLTSTLAGATLLFMVAFGLKSRGKREYLVWIGTFSALVFFGLLRESEILPDLGDPLTNLLVAFVPFAVGSLCLSLGARNLLKYYEQ